MHQDKTQPNPNRASKKEVDLFPAVVEKNLLDGPLEPTRSSGSHRGGTEITMFNPSTYEEALDIVASLRSRAATTISLESMRKMDATRLVDFVTGASAALDGNYHKLNDNVYFFSPSNIQIVTEAKVTPKVENNPLDYLYPGFPKDDKAGLSAFWPKS